MQRCVWWQELVAEISKLVGTYVFVSFCFIDAHKALKCFGFWYHSYFTFCWSYWRESGELQRVWSFKCDDIFWAENLCFWPHRSTSAWAKLKNNMPLHQTWYVVQMYAWVWWSEASDDVQVGVKRIKQSRWFQTGWATETQKNCFLCEPERCDAAGWMLVNPQISYSTPFFVDRNYHATCVQTNTQMWCLCLRVIRTVRGQLLS